ncbi:hypothetical protein [Cysteiniphilum halobium]|uniref:hypothetical protein n=1 Tax=Cysteiniphilum halobium TaxID=2219059 RepID=UPI003F876C25
MKDKKIISRLIALITIISLQLSFANSKFDFIIQNFNKYHQAFTVSNARGYYGGNITALSYGPNPYQLPNAYGWKFNNTAMNNDTVKLSQLSDNTLHVELIYDEGMYDEDIQIWFDIESSDVDVKNRTFKVQFDNMSDNYGNCNYNTGYHNDICPISSDIPYMTLSLPPFVTTTPNPLSCYGYSFCTLDDSSYITIRGYDYSTLKVVSKNDYTAPITYNTSSCIKSGEECQINVSGASTFEGRGRIYVSDNTYSTEIPITIEHAN